MAESLDAVKKVKEVDLYSAFIVVPHSRRSGTDHTVLPANYTIYSTCLYLVSIHQMAHPRTEVADIAAYYSFIYPECYGTKQRKGLRRSRNWPQVGPTGPEESLRWSLAFRFWSFYGLL